MSTQALSFADLPLQSRRRTNVDPHKDLLDAVSITRFWRLVNASEPHQCWQWLGDTDKDGYGVFVWRGRRYQAPELSLSFTIGEKRHPDLDTCHSCDNPSCCNPNHLRFDTRKSNVGDMYTRGRANNPKVLTDSQVRIIRERRALGARQKDLAAQYGCTDGYISSIVRGLKRLDAGGPLETERKIVRG